jgi:hypothetical protein
MKHVNSGLLIIGSSILILSSCLKETLDDLTGIKGIKVSNSFSAPLIDATLGMKEIYETYSDKAFISEAPNKQLIFTYAGGDTVAPKQFVAIPPVPFDYALQMNPLFKAEFENSGKLEVSFDQTLTLPTANNEQIKLINVKEGSFSVSISNGLMHNATIVIIYPSVTKNGQALADTIDVIYDPLQPLPQTQSVQIDLSGYNVDFTDGGGGSNKIPFTYGMTLTNTGRPTVGDEILSVNQTFEINSYNHIIGYVGRFNVLTAQESQEIDLFDKQTAGKIFVNDPKLRIRVYNTFGVPVTGRINNLRVSTASGFEFPVTVDPFKDTFSFAKPTVMGETAVSEYLIDKHNSNIDQAINIAPSFIRFDIDFDANYREIVADNFLLDTAAFIIDTDFEIPLDLKIVGYEVLQEERPKESDTSELLYVKDVKLQVRAENTLPFDLFAQMIFTRDTVINGIDTSYVTDSLFYPELPVVGALVDADGEVIAPTVTTSTVSLDVERYNRIQRSQNYMFRIRSESSSFGGAQSFVKIYSTQQLNIKIGADIKLTYKSNE